jgi:hypothetical protein
MTNNKQQTAVEWLEETMLKPLIQWPDDIWEQAKEMEKEQMINSRENGLLWGVRSTNNFYADKIIESEEYYEQTYGGNK